MEKEFEEALNETVNKFADVILQATNEPKNATNLTNAVDYLERTPQIIALRKALTELKAIKEANPSEALEEIQKYLFNEWKQNHVNFGCDYKLEAELEKQLNNLKAVKQALIEFKRLDLLLRLSSEQSSSHFTYKDKNLVCMQSTKYSKLMNAFLEYEKAQELEKELAELNQHIKRWHDLLLKTGINSKGTVVDEIENYWQIKTEK